MIAVIFEVEPSQDGHALHFRHSARLRPTLEHMDGFIPVAHFQSLTNPRKQGPGF